MPLPDLILESSFEKSLFDFVRQTLDLDDIQLDAAAKLLEGMRPLEDKLLLVMLGAAHFMASEDDYGHQFLTKQIDSELRRRVTFIEGMQRQMRTSCAERIRSIEKEALRRRQGQICASS